MTTPRATAPVSSDRSSMGDSPPSKRDTGSFLLTNRSHSEKGASFCRVRSSTRRAATSAPTTVKSSSTASRQVCPFSNRNLTTPQSPNALRNSVSDIRSADAFTFSQASACVSAFKPGVTLATPSEPQTVQSGANRGTLAQDATRWWAKKCWSRRIEVGLPSTRHVPIPFVPPFRSLHTAPARSSASVSPAMAVLRSETRVPSAPARTTE